MKTSRTKLKSSLVAFSLVSLSVMAKPVAQVSAVRGQVFVVTAEGSTKSLKMNDIIEEKSEVMVGEDGDVTLNDYFDANYHLIEGSHMKFFTKSVQLKKGKSWIQSLSAKHPLALTTANGSVNFWKAEFITTFDQGSGKTQVLVVNGEAEVSNILDKNMKYIVPAGNFTLVDPDVENGSPRTPTKVGLASLNKALSEFKDLPTEMKVATSQIENRPATVPGKIVFMTNGQAIRKPASVSAHNYLKKKTVLVKKITLAAAPIRFYGMGMTRVPASIALSHTAQAAPKKVGRDLNIDPEFKESLRLEQAMQPKHSKELDNLIQDLKSY